MPYLKGTYDPPFIYRSADAATIYAGTLRKVHLDNTESERITLSDGDFIDVDWNSPEADSKRIVILLHGLEGRSDRPYMKGMAKIFLKENWHTLRMNCRGCSDELNNRYRSYHAGATDDLSEVITHVLAKKKYDEIALIGFSLGGNMVLNYMGENRKIPEQIIGSVTISVPCDLAGSLGTIERMRNFVYSKRFELSLKKHLLKRAQKFPDRISKKQIAACTSIRDIDELYTSRAHGYENAEEYYKKTSALGYLQNIQKPSLLISAKNDTFLSPSSYPVAIAENSEKFYFEETQYGGHTAFVTNSEFYYHEQRAVAFLSKLLNA